MIDRGEHGLRRHLIPDPHGHVADDAARGRGHRVVAELHLLLLNLGLQRLEVRFGGFEQRFRLLELLLADGAGRVERARALLLLPRVAHVGFPRGALGFLARDGGLLATRIDLHERRTLRHAVARLHQDLGYLPVDLGLDRRRVERFESRDVLGRVLNGARVRGRQLHGGRREALPARRCPLIAAAADDHHERGSRRDPYQTHTSRTF